MKILSRTNKPPNKSTSSRFRGNGTSTPFPAPTGSLKAIHGERDEAIALWERAAKLDPSNASVLWNLSIAYREAGDITRSERFRNAALSLLER